MWYAKRIAHWQVFYRLIVKRLRTSQYFKPPPLATIIRHTGPSLKISIGYFLYVPSSLRYAPLSRFWTSAACGTSSDLMASVCLPTSWLSTLVLPLFVSTDTAVWLTSVLTSQLATLPLAWLGVTTPLLTGLPDFLFLKVKAPFGTLLFWSYIHHSRRTHCVWHMGRIRWLLWGLAPHSTYTGRVASHRVGRN